MNSTLNQPFTKQDLLICLNDCISQLLAEEYSEPIESFFVPPLLMKTAEGDNIHMFNFMTCLDGCEQSFKDINVYVTYVAPKNRSLLF